jgi:hypothetical protein
LLAGYGGDYIKIIPGFSGYLQTKADNLAFKVNGDPPSEIMLSVNLNGIMIGNGYATSSRLLVRNSSSTQPIQLWQNHLGTNLGTFTYDGNLGIGTSSPIYKLDVVGNIRTSGCVIYNGGTLGTCASDIRLKDNIMNLKFDNAIEKIIKLQPKKFVFKQDPNHEMHGLIAQEVEEFAPELIQIDQNGYKQIKYGDIQWLMVKALQELNYKIINIEKDHNHLKSQIQTIKQNFNL